MPRRIEVGTPTVSQVYEMHERTAEEVMQQYWDEDPNPVRIGEIRPVTDLPDNSTLQTRYLQPTIFSDSNWRIINENNVMEGEPIPVHHLSVVSSPSQVEPEDLWGAQANARRYNAEIARSITSSIQEDPYPERPSGTYTATINAGELADEGRTVVQANRDRRVYRVDESTIEVGVPVPSNVDRRCVVRADRKQGIESVKTE